MVSKQSHRFKFLEGVNTFGQDKFDSTQPSISQEQDAICSNGIFTAMPWKRAATTAVFPAYGFCRFDNNIKLLMGHKGNVTDCAFSPFNNNLLATSSEDGSAKLWLIPDGGITDNVMEADADLVGHTKKVMAV